MVTKHALSPHISVGAEPTVAELEALAAEGFKAIVSNRPDHEDGVALSSSEMRDVAARLGLAFEHIPVEGRNPMEGSVRAFSDSLAAHPGPIYAYCKTGGRSAALWALASVREHDNAHLIEVCAAAGHDISMLEPKLNSRRILLEDEDDD